MQLFCGIVLLGIGVYAGRATAPSQFTPQQALRETGYKYIEPLLTCSVNPSNHTDDLALRSKVLSYIKTLPKDTDVSVYFQEFRSGGNWMGINENEVYAPASMLKLPTLMAVLKYADSNADFLSKKLYYDGSFNYDDLEYFRPQQAIKPKQYYTVDQLLTYTIVYSDNNAMYLLNSNIDQSSLESIYINMGIQLPEDLDQNPDFMSAKTYSLFLRILFNSTYLSHNSSEKALALMTEADFPQGIEAGIPDSIDVAQKYGEREIATSDGTATARELHDCGIVYVPNNPYVLCVMTRGEDYNSLATTIAGISRIVYGQVAAEKSLW